MDFSLSSSLVGSAVLNPDRLSLDLQFAADKALTARKGPTPTFTRGSAGRFVGSDGLIQSAAVNTARFDYDPVTLACRGLLIEESRTNLLLRSEGLDASPWIQINTTTITSNNTTAPDGATTAERFTVGATTQAYGFFNSTTSWTSGVTYTSSFFLKADQVTRVRISAGSQATHPISAIFDLTGNGSIVGTPTGTAYIERYANGWYRCSVTATSTATGLTSLRVTAVTGTNDNYPGNSVDSFWAWGAQNEVGAFATSYIPTVASSVVRSADVCSITGSAFTGFYNPLEGSFATSQIFNAPATVTQGQVVFDVNDTTILNRTRLVRNATNGFMIYANTVNGTQDVAITGSTAMNAGAVTKFAGCMKANDFTIYLNNVSQGVDTVATMQSAPTTFTIGDASSGLTRVPLNGTIAAIRYFRKRLPNAKLQAFTV
jgi:hypothetical protein